MKTQNLNQIWIVIFMIILIVAVDIIKVNHAFNRSDQKTDSLMIVISETKSIVRLITHEVSHSIFEKFKDEHPTLFIHEIVPYNAWMEGRSLKEIDSILNQ